MSKPTIVLKVASASNPGALAGSIAKNIQEGKLVELIAVGAAAVNQSVKAMTIARGYVATQGLDLTFRPGFQDIEIEGETKTAIKFIVLTEV